MTKQKAPADMTNLAVALMASSLFASEANARASGRPAEARRIRRTLVALADVRKAIRAERAFKAAPTTQPEASHG